MCLPPSRCCPNHVFFSLFFLFPGAGGGIHVTRQHDPESLEVRRRVTGRDKTYMGLDELVHKVELDTLRYPPVGSALAEEA